jgi:nucleoid DNA-binding protein
MMQRYETVFIRRRDPTWADLQHQAEANRLHRESRAAIVRRYDQRYLQTINCIRHLGVLWDGEAAHELPAGALQFLTSEFGAKLVPNRRGVLMVVFPKKRERRLNKMRLADSIVERTGYPRQTVRAVLVALLEVVKQGLKEERRVRIPELVTLSAVTQAAQPQRQGRNFAGQLVQLPARAARVKLRATPARALRDSIEPALSPVERRKKQTKRGVPTLVGKAKTMKTRRKLRKTVSGWPRARRREREKEKKPY